MKKCPDCGETDQKEFYKHKGYCKKCLSQKSIKRKTEYKKQWTDFLNEQKGSKCVMCGYDSVQRALELHHIYPEQKTISFSDFMWERPFNEDNKKIIMEELKIAVRVCNRCHVELHEKGAIL